MKNRTAYVQKHHWSDLAQVAVPFFWVGLVVAISFLEAPLKFRAPGVTLALGLGIGNLVFTALNRIEIALAAALVLLRWRGSSVGRRAGALLTAICVCLSLQTVWLLPALKARAALIMGGVTPPPSYHHLAFGVLEVLKACMLLALGMLAWNKFHREDFDQGK